MCCTFTIWTRTRVSITTCTLFTTCTASTSTFDTRTLSIMHDDNRENNKKYVLPNHRVWLYYIKNNKMQD